MLSDLVINPNNSNFAIACENNIARICNLEIGIVLHIIKHDSEVNSCTYNPLGTLLITVSNDRFARLWNVETGELIRLFYHNFLKNVKYSSNNEYLATKTFSKEIKIWDLNNGLDLKLNKITDCVNDYNFSYDSKLFITTEIEILKYNIFEHNQTVKQYSVKIWDVITGELLHTFKHDDCIKSATITSNNKYLLTLADKSISIWNLNTKTLIQEIKDIYTTPS